MPVSQRKFTAADLIPAKTYRVIAGFKDYDGVIHAAGETWIFLEKNFLPYEDGLSLFLNKEGQRVQLRLQWREETQGRIIDGFSGFVEEL